MAREHSWTDLDGDVALLECKKTGVDFWDVVRADYLYCPACGEKL